MGDSMGMVGPAITSAELAKTIEEHRRARDARMRERRSSERFPLESAYGELVYKGKKNPCHFIDISMGGCCLRTEERFTPGSLAGVEVVLPIYGLILSICGITQWTTRDHLVGVRFIHPGARSKNQLAGLLTCLVDQSAAEVVKEAVLSTSSDQRGSVIVAAESSRHIHAVAAPVPMPPQHQAPPPPAAPPALAAESELRNPVEGEWSAVLQILKENLRLKCTMVDLSLGGCKLRTAKPYTSSANAHVEVEFQMQGLPFRLGGVARNVLDQNTIAIHFQQLTYRRREELAELIEELRAASAAAAKAAAPEAAAATPSEPPAPDAEEGD